MPNLPYEFRPIPGRPQPQPQPQPQPPSMLAPTVPEPPAATAPPPTPRPATPLPINTPRYRTYRERDRQRKAEILSKLSIRDYAPDTDRIARDLLYGEDRP